MTMPVKLGDVPELVHDFNQQHPFGLVPTSNVLLTVNRRIMYQMMIQSSRRMAQVEVQDTKQTHKHRLATSLVPFDRRAGPEPP